MQAHAGMSVGFGRCDTAVSINACGNAGQCEHLRAIAGLFLSLGSGKLEGPPMIFDESVHVVFSRIPSFVTLHD